MKEELVQKSIIAVKLPRSFYDFFMTNHLWDEYSSFSDWVRDCVRMSRDRWKNKIALQKYSKKTVGEKIQEDFEGQ